MQGAIYQMLAHGVSTGALFLLVGMLYESRHTFEIVQYGGLATPMPRFSAFFLFVVLSSLGLPMLNGFVGEYLILLGTYTSHFGITPGNGWKYATWATVGVRKTKHCPTLPQCSKKSLACQSKSVELTFVP